MPIQANQLRIGNYVNEEVLGNVCISELNGSCSSVLASNMKVDRTIELVSYSISYHELRPIPLTEDIILKCGFEKIQPAGWYSKVPFPNSQQFQIFKPDGEPFHYADGAFSPELKYVHQLQNLYYTLTTIELEITF